MRILCCRKVLCESEFVGYTVMDKTVTRYLMELFQKQQEGQDAGFGSR